MKLVTSLQYLHTYHWGIPRTLLFELDYDDLKPLSSQNYEFVDPLV
jgi:hypothetical protein